MEDRHGFKIVYLAEFALFLFIVSVGTALSIFYGWVGPLFWFPVIVVSTGSGVLFLYVSSKPESIEQMYKYPGWGSAVGLSLCITAVIMYITQANPILGNPISLLLYFVSGLLFIVASQVMVRETKTGLKNECISGTK